MEAKTLEAVMEQREATYSEQMHIGLTTILALAGERDVADKALASYVQSFDAFKSSLRAILDRERDGRLASADMQELKDLAGLSSKSSSPATKGNG